MIVKAAPGLRVPKEDKPREYITETDAVEVPETAYYVRAIVCGDLLPVGVEDSTPPLAAAKSGKKE